MKYNVTEKVEANGQHYVSLNLFIVTILLASSSSTVVLHFSRLIRLMAHLSFLGLHMAACTTAVAPAPKNI
jgi:hypothetical protein